MGRERAGHTLQPSALVNEAYLRLIDVNQVQWQNRAQFFGVAARTMRRILVDFARARASDKRGGGAHTLTLDEDGHIVGWQTRDAAFVCCEPDGKRTSRPEVAFAQAVYGILLGIGTLCHSTDGLWARRLGPVTRRCAEAEAFIRGHRLWPLEGPRLRYVNEGHAGAPVRKARVWMGRSCGSMEASPTGEVSSCPWA